MRIRPKHPDMQELLRMGEKERNATALYLKTLEVQTMMDLADELQRMNDGLNNAPKIIVGLTESA